MMNQHKPLPRRPVSRRPLLAWSVVAGLVGLSAIPLALAWRAQSAGSTPDPSPALLPGASSALSDTRLVVDLRDDATPQDIAELNQRLGISLRHGSLDKAGRPVTKSNIVRADLKPSQNMDALIAALKADPRVEAAEPEVRVEIPKQEVSASRFHSRSRDERDRADASASTWEASPAESRTYPELPKPRRGWTPNDEMYPRQWNLRMVGAERAWKRSRGEGVVVAVIDTGVASKTTKKGEKALDFEQTEIVPGYDFINGDDDPYDGNGHGTHVAGTIAESTNNREGVAGLAFEASIMPIKVLSDDGFGTAEGVAEGIRWAVDNGANVINLSLGSPYPSDIERKAVRYARRHNVLVVCAAGNSGMEGVGYPAAFPGSVAVSSVGPTGEMAFYSSYGAQVALAAPGGDRSVDMENGGILQSTFDIDEEGERKPGYFQFNGTSMASPHVAAVAAMLMAQGVHDSSRVRDLLLRSATARGPQLQYGAGILSADKATSLARRWGWASMFKTWIWAFLVLPLAWKKPRSWWSPAAWAALGSWWLRPLLGLAFWLGAFGPDWIAAFAGANSPLNLLAFSALAPAIAFWRMPDVRGARITMALAAGTSLCLLASTWGGLLSPFTGTPMGWAVWPWVLSNLMASVTIAGASWLKSQSTLH